MPTEAQQRAHSKYIKENMAFQTVKVNKKLLEKFRATVKARGDKVNTVLRQAMINYIGEEEAVEATTEATEEE